jgi:hypothetical protein
MTYLAALLGQLKEVRSTPVTDVDSNLDPFLLASYSKPNVESRLAPLRKIVLERLLPVPELPMEPTRLRAFKKRHGVELSRFRHSIEQEISALADMTDPDLQNHRLENFIADKQAEVEQISAHLSEGGLGYILFSKLCAIIAAIPRAHPVFGLANAVYSALSGSSRQVERGALLYAAYVKKKLG